MIKKAVEYIRIPKKIFFTVVGLAIVGFALWSLRPEFTPVDLGTVTEGTFIQSIDDEGTTAFKVKHVLSAPADGITPSLDIEAGDKVKKGQVLFKFLWDMDFPMKSPVDGYVLRVYEKDRRHVVRGTPILEVGNPDSLEIISKLLSEEVLDVQIGQKVKVTNWGKDEALDAEVIKIEPAAKEEVSALGVKEKRVNVHMKIISDKELWKDLGDGFRLDVSVITAQIEGARLLPVGAIFSSEGSPAVFTVVNKKLELVPVKIGERNRDYVNLKSDLPVGTQVVMYPGSGLRAGDKVKPRY